MFAFTQLQARILSFLAHFFKQKKKKINKTPFICMPPRGLINIRLTLHVYYIDVQPAEAESMAELSGDKSGSDIMKAFRITALWFERITAILMPKWPSLKQSSQTFFFFKQPLPRPHFLQVTTDIKENKLEPKSRWDGIKVRMQVKVIIVLWLPYSRRIGACKGLLNMLRLTVKIKGVLAE